MIGVAAPALGPLERQYVAEAMASGWISSRGPFVERFESGFAGFCGASHGIACSSGTNALHLALASLGVGAGDEVIVPSFTMIGTVNPVRYTGATPVACDVRADTWTLDPESVRAVRSGRTRAIIVMHTYGHPADVDAIRAAAPGIPIIEDAAEAHGSQWRGQRAGALGDIAAFSFYANKILTTGEGGMVVTSRADLAERCRSLRDHAFGGDESRYRHEAIGFSYRMSNLQAAVGTAQVERAAELVEASRHVGERYRAALSGLAGLTLQAESEGARSAWWVTGLVVGEGSRLDRDQLRAALKEKGVETRSFFHPVHLQPSDAGSCVGGECPVSERLGERGFYLPSGAGRTDAEVDAVIAILRETCGAP